MFTDREIAGAHERDQTQARVKGAAGDIGLFYREALGSGVPEDLAGSLTKMFASMVVFGGCGCGVDG